MATALHALLFFSLFLLGGSVFWKDRRTHGLRAAAWPLFGAFFLAEAPVFWSSGDLFNFLATLLALPAFLFVSYQEILSYRWDEEYTPLRFLAGVTFVASLIYYGVAVFPEVSSALIKVVADHTVLILRALNLPYTAGPSAWSQGEIAVPLTLQGVGNTINIVLACTALQAIAVAGSFIFATGDPRRQKALAAVIILPSIYAMNLVRNVLIIYTFDIQRVDFELVHGYIGKGFSLLVLIVLLLLAYKLLPDLYEMVNGLLDLPWRRKPNHNWHTSPPLFKKSAI